MMGGPGLMGFLLLWSLVYFRSTNAQTWRNSTNTNDTFVEPAKPVFNITGGFQYVDPLIGTSAGGLFVSRPDAGLD